MILEDGPVATEISLPLKDVNGKPRRASRRSRGTTHRLSCQSKCPPWRGSSRRSAPSFRSGSNALRRCRGRGGPCGLQGASGHPTETKGYQGTEAHKDGRVSNSTATPQGTSMHNCIKPFWLRRDKARSSLKSRHGRSPCRSGNRRKSRCRRGCRRRDPWPPWRPLRHRRISGHRN